MDVIEKRKTPRIIVDDVSVEVRVLPRAGSESEPHEICQVKNISEIGMLFETPMAFYPGDLLRLTFALPDSPIVIRTDAIVVHETKRKKFEIGVQFKELAIAEQKLLQHFIARATAESAPQA